MSQIHYVQVTHLPFFRKPNGPVVIDEVWSKDLESLAKRIGPFRVVAPELRRESELQTWGPTSTEISSETGITFTGLPPIRSQYDWLRISDLKKILYREVANANVVHSSNWFPPYLCLYYAHHLAIKLQKKTVMVIAEDFYDMLDWEWVRTASSSFEKWRRQRLLDKMDHEVRRAIAKASISFMHTPSVVTRYRCNALNGITIQLPTHNLEDIISDRDFDAKCRHILSGVPLVISVLARHKPLKGLDCFIRAIGELKKRGVPVQARIYGDGMMRAELESLAVHLGLKDYWMTFLGLVPPGRPLYQALAETHLFIMPHLTNDFGRTFFDAMAGGTPVIAFRTPASVETVSENVDGLLVPLGNIISLSYAIERLHHDRKLLVTMAEAARARAKVETQDSWQAFRCERIKELFDQDKR